MRKKIGAGDTISVKFKKKDKDAIWITNWYGFPIIMEVKKK